MNQNYQNIVVSTVPVNPDIPEISIRNEIIVNEPSSSILLPHHIRFRNGNFIKSIAFNKNHPKFMAYSCMKEVFLLELDFDNYRNSVIKKTCQINKFVDVMKIHEVHPIMAILGFQSSSIHLWHVNFDKLDETVYIARISGYNYIYAKLNDVAFHPIFPLFVANNSLGYTKIWKFKWKNKFFESGQKMDVKTKKEIRFNENAKGISFDREGNNMAIGVGNKIMLWNISQQNRRTEIVKNTELDNPTFVLSIDFMNSPNMIIAGLESSVILWNFLTKNIILKINNILVNSFFNSVSMNPRYNNILVTFEREKIKFWKLDLENFRQSKYERTIKKGYGEKFYSFNFHPTQNIFVTGGEDSSIKIWELNDEGIPIHGNNTLQFTTPQIRSNTSNTRIIRVDSRLIRESQNSEACKNLRPLYDFIMQQNLNGELFFIFEGETGIDRGGLTREVFDKILKFYTLLYFQEIEGNNNFLILRENVDMQAIVNHTNQLILLANAAKSYIYLRIDQRLINLLLSNNPKNFINNSKRNSFRNLYSFFETQISQIQEENANSVSNYFINNNKKSKITYNTLSQYNTLDESIKREIKFRRFCIMCGFKTWEEFNKMLLFIQKYWLNSGKIESKNIFTCELKFDKLSIIQRLKIEKVISSEVVFPKTIKELKLDGISSEFNNYPFLQLILSYILGDNSSDENRENFVQYLTGSKTSPAQLIIELSNMDISQLHVAPYYGQPFVAHTCFGSIELFKKPSTHNINRNTLTESWVSNEIRKGLSSATNR